jgi:fibronectin-binding autotransporter adhesin
MNAADAGSVAFAVSGSHTYALAGLTGSRNLALGDNTLAIQAGADSDYSGVLSGTGGLAKGGAGTLTLAGANTYTGATVINVGTLRLASTAASSSYAIASGGVLEIQVAGGLDTRFSGGTYTGGGTLRKTGTGQIHWFGGTNIALDAGATVDVQVGRLQASWGANQIWTNNQSSLNVASGAEFDVDAAHARFSGLSGAGTIVLGLSGPYLLQKLTVGVADASSDFAGVIRNGSATAPLEKVGAGTLTLSGANTYTGATAVSAGRLAVNGSLANTAVTVASGATLGGSGSIAGSVTIQSGATLAPGNSPGILRTGTLTLAGLLEVEIAGLARGSAGYDSTEVTGSVTLGATSSLDISLLNGFQPRRDAIFFILVNDGTDAITGTFDGFADGARFSLAGQQWQISYVANYTGEHANLGVSLGTLTGGNDIALVAVPEPSTYGLLLGALALAATALRRRRKKDQ